MTIQQKKTLKRLRMIFLNLEMMSFMSSRHFSTTVMNLLKMSKKKLKVIMKLILELLLVLRQN